MSGQALAIYDVAPVIHSHRVKYVLCDIDPEDVYLLLHGTRLLWLHGFTALELIVAHCSRSAQGRVHFITTQRRASAERNGHDQGQTRGAGGGNASVAEAAGGNGGAAVLAKYHGRPRGGGPRRIARVWELSGPRAQATTGAQPPHRRPGGHSREAGPVVQARQSAPRAGERPPGRP